jgi:hypothetical protein
MLHGDHPAISGNSGQIHGNRAIELQTPLQNQPQHGRRRELLGGRGNLKERGRSVRDLLIQVGAADARRRNDLPFPRGQDRAAESSRLRSLDEFDDAPADLAVALPFVLTRFLRGNGAAEAKDNYSERDSSLCDSDSTSSTSP